MFVGVSDQSTETNQHLASTSFLFIVFSLLLNSLTSSSRPRTRVSFGVSPGMGFPHVPGPSDDVSRRFSIMSPSCDFSSYYG